MEQCAGGTQSAENVGQVWDNCNISSPTTTTTAAPLVACQADDCITEHGCRCLMSWDYQGSTMTGCALTPGHPETWCYVADPDACVGGMQSQENPGHVWDNCGMLFGNVAQAALDVTDHDCHCETTWEYGGHTFHGCSDTGDHEDKWCYVNDGPTCPGSIKTSKEGRYWDTCDGATSPATTSALPSVACQDEVCSTEHGCRCLMSWEYQGSTMSGCALTPGHPQTWCYVVNAETCVGGTQSQENPGHTWDNCGEILTTTLTPSQLDITDHGCHCHPSWPYGGHTFFGCSETGDHAGAWCYVTDGQSCPGSIKTSKTGDYWDTCVPRSAMFFVLSGSTPVRRHGSVPL